MAMDPVSGYNSASAPKKIAKVAVGAGAIASLVYAAKKGEGDKFVKKVGNGYQKLGGSISEKAHQAIDFVKSKFLKAKEGAEKVIEGAAE